MKIYILDNSWQCGSGCHDCYGIAYRRPTALISELIICTRVFFLLYHFEAFTKYF